VARLRRQNAQTDAPHTHTHTRARARARAQRPPFPLAQRVVGGLRCPAAVGTHGWSRLATAAPCTEGFDRALEHNEDLRRTHARGRADDGPCALSTHSRVYAFEILEARFPPPIDSAFSSPDPRARKHFHTFIHSYIQLSRSHFACIRTHAVHSVPLQCCKQTCKRQPKGKHNLRLGLPIWVVKRGPGVNPTGIDRPEVGLSRRSTLCG